MRSFLRRHPSLTLAGPPPEWAPSVIADKKSRTSFHYSMTSIAASWPVRCWCCQVLNVSHLVVCILRPRRRVRASAIRVGFFEGMVVVVWEHDSIVEPFSSAPFAAEQRKVDRDRRTVSSSPIGLVEVTCLHRTDPTVSMDGRTFLASGNQLKVPGWSDQWKIMGHFPTWSWDR